MNEFRPTAHLRFARSPHTTTEPAELQQLWVMDVVNKYGHVDIAAREEWRPIPWVVLDR